MERTLSGFGSYFESEAVAGALPTARNSPQRAPHGLYAEQLSGSAFTAPRHENLRTWLYRARPSVGHGAFTPFAQSRWLAPPSAPTAAGPNQLRWSPMPSSGAHDFVEGIFTMAGNGSAHERAGSAVHLYNATRSMDARYFANFDGELLVVPQQGALVFHTEMGRIDAKPGHIVLLPRGMRFRVELAEKAAAGYVCENFGAPFRLPELGPIGSNGLANPRDFHAPSAAFEEKDAQCELVVKFDGALWHTMLDHSPLDVVAWHGNYVPFHYDLARFNTIGTVSYDHPDPSIFTVLTSPSERLGTANADFVIFPPRWMVATDTFRPPYFHRNVMSEFMGLVHGAYDAKKEGFLPGGASLHNCMSAHGPDRETFDKASNADLAPHYIDKTLAFMFESAKIYRPTKQALEAPFLQKDYLACWNGLAKNFRR